MNLETIVKDIFNKNTINIISKQSGLDKQATKESLKKILPLFLGGLQKNILSDEGKKELENTIEKKHNKTLDLSNGIDLEDGKKILGHIFGEKTKEIEKKSGNPNILRTLGPIVLGIIGKNKKDGKLDLEQLSKDLGNYNNNNMLISFLDKNGDGNIKDDIYKIIINFIKNNLFKKNK